MRLLNKTLIGNSGANFFDANVFIGKHHNPFGPMPFTTSQLSGFVGHYGYTDALVYHSAAVSYDAAYGNQILIEESAGARFLHRIWVSLPEFTVDTKAAEQFVATAQDYSVKAIKVFPRTHNFAIQNRCLDPLLAVLGEKGLPLLVDQEEISWEEVNYILKSFPGLHFVLTNVGYRLGRYVYPLLDRYAHFHLEISRFQVHRGLEEMCRLFGSNQLMFGSGLPVFSPEPSMMMILSAEIHVEDKRNIAGKNLRRLLHLE